MWTKFRSLLKFLIFQKTLTLNLQRTDFFKKPPDTSRDIYSLFKSRVSKAKSLNTKDIPPSYIPKLKVISRIGLYCSMATMISSRPCRDGFRAKDPLFRYMKMENFTEGEGPMTGIVLIAQCWLLKLFSFKGSRHQVIFIFDIGCVMIT